MLIRSQDNKKLVNLSNVECISIRTYDDTTDIWCGGYLIGEYSTEEKAIKVLDMLERRCLEVIGYKHSTFQMPADDEVEDD